MRLVERYSRFLTQHPYIVLAGVVILSILAFIGAGMVEMKDFNYKSALPEGIDVIVANNIVEDEFGGSSSAKIAIETDPSYAGSNEPRDVREPEVIRYISLLSQASEQLDDVMSVTSASTLLKAANGGRLPKSERDTKELSGTIPLMESYISRDYTLSIINMRLSEEYDDIELANELKRIIDEMPGPPGLDVQIAGRSMEDPIIQEKIGPDMSRTSAYSLIGIVLILLLLFRSMKYSLTPLMTIGIGVLWAFGFVGFMGMGLNSATSGVISMIMGIGIDFGIQTVTRFRQELQKKDPGDAMRITMCNVMKPMFTTTLAALIGFQAMSMGQLTFLAEMGRIMSYGITACFLVAVTAVPSVLVIWETYAQGKKI